jgi:transposase
MPLKDAESIFAIDATGFSISRYETYFSAKHLKNVHWKAYRKCHAVCGVASNIIVAVKITPGRVNDITQFEELVKDTARNFKIEDFVADKGYLSKKSYNLIKELGGQAWIPFKKNQHGKSTCGGDSYAWRTMFRYFRDHQEEFYKRYHQRSNIESCFSMIKRKFGNNVKCKKEISQNNEILAKVLVHNLCVLIQEIFLNDVDVNFSACFNQYVARN